MKRKGKIVVLWTWFVAALGGHGLLSVDRSGGAEPRKNTAETVLRAIEDLASPSGAKHEAAVKRLKEVPPAIAVSIIVDLLQQDERLLEKRMRRSAYEGLNHLNAENLDIGRSQLQLGLLEPD